jgi:hypothetical protein
VALECRRTGLRVSDVDDDRHAPSTVRRGGSAGGCPCRGGAAEAVVYGGVPSE